MSLVEAFFARLPRGQLTPDERELRDLLHRTAIAARRLLPRHGQVTLQDWMEHRMPGELLLCSNAEGRIALTQPPAGEEEEPAAAPPAVAPPTPKAPPKLDPGASQETFFRGLPTDAFTSEEERLREAVTAALAQGPLSVAQVVKDPQVSSIAKTFFPRGATLAAWIERRIGAEVSLFDDDEGTRMCRVAAAAGKDEKREAFFGTLPSGSFSQEEERLRGALFDFLAAWKSKELATLSHAGGDKAVQQARIALLPHGVTLRDWIERRIGGELELRQDRKGQYVVHLTAAARHEVTGRFEALKRSGGLEAREAREPREPREAPATAEAVRAEFFEGLPADELLPTELELRQALLDFLEAWGRTHGAPPVLADAGKDRSLQQCKAALLPREVALKDWIERRIGGEVQTRLNARGQVQVSLRGPRRGRRPPEEPAGAQEEEPTEEERPEKEPARAAVAERREAFFEGLPTDGFLPAEERLREAILDFIEAWPGPEPPTLSSAGGDPRIRDARAAILPKGSGVSLREWIDRRIGGEVETQPDSTSTQVAIGLRGQLDPAAAARAMRKRKLDAGNGTEHAGVAGGKGAKGRGIKARHTAAPIGMDPAHGPTAKKIR